MPRLRVIVAPDSFKGSASATVVAAAIARGWRETRPQDDVTEVPMADGGEGTLDAFEVGVVGAERRFVDVPGPDGRPVRAPWLMLPGGTAVVELAAASGLQLMSSPAPYEAHTRGVGRVVATALDAGATRIVIGLGGSASTDAGAGLLSELGARLLDSVGDVVVDGAHGVAAAARLDLTRMRPLPPRGVTVLSDVVNPLFGPRGAAFVFGPQKGASIDDVLALDSGLEHVADLVAVDPRTPGAGAAGGTGFALLAWGASLVSGAEAVAALVGLDDVVAGAVVVVTGEGRFDDQTADGKVVSFVAGLAARAGVPTMLVAGSVEAPTDGFAAVVSTTELAGGAEASRAGAASWAERAGAELARRQTLSEAS